MPNRTKTSEILEKDKRLVDSSMEKQIARFAKENEVSASQIYSDIQLRKVEYYVRLRIKKTDICASFPIEIEHMVIDSPIETDGEDEQ